HFLWSMYSGTPLGERAASDWSRSCARTSSPLRLAALEVRLRARPKPLPVDTPAGPRVADQRGRLGVGNLDFGPFHPLGIRYWNHRVKRSLRTRLEAAARLGQSLEPPEVTGQIPDASKPRVKLTTRRSKKTRRG